MTSHLLPTTTVLNWIVVGLSLLLLALAITHIVGKRLMVGPGRRSLSPGAVRRLGVAQAGMSAFLLLETVPRLAGWPPLVVLIFSVVAVVPLVLSIVVTVRTNRMAPAQP